MEFDKIFVPAAARSWLILICTTAMLVLQLLVCLCFRPGSVKSAAIGRVIDTVSEFSSSELKPLSALVL